MDNLAVQTDRRIADPLQHHAASHARRAAAVPAAVARFHVVCWRMPGPPTGGARRPVRTTAPTAAPAAAPATARPAHEADAAARHLIAVRLAVVAGVLGRQQLDGEVIERRGVGPLRRPELLCQLGLEAFALRLDEGREVIALGRAHATAGAARRAAAPRRAAPPLDLQTARVARRARRAHVVKLVKLVGRAAAGRRALGGAVRPRAPSAGSRSPLRVRATSGWPLARARDYRRGHAHLHAPATPAATGGRGLLILFVGAGSGAGSGGGGGRGGGLGPVRCESRLVPALLPPAATALGARGRLERRSHLARARSEVEWRLARPILDVGLGTVGEQRLHTLGRCARTGFGLRLDRMVQRCRAGLVGRVDVCRPLAMGAEDADERGVGEGCGNVQAAGALVVGNARIRAGLEQHLHDVHHLLEARVSERREPLVALVVELLSGWRLGGLKPRPNLRPFRRFAQVAQRRGHAAWIWQPCTQGTVAGRPATLVGTPPARAILFFCASFYGCTNGCTSALHQRTTHCHLRLRAGVCSSSTASALSTDSAPLPPPRTSHRARWGWRGGVRGAEATPLDRERHGRRLSLRLMLGGCNQRPASHAVRQRLAPVLLVALLEVLAEPHDLNGRDDPLAAIGERAQCRVDGRRLADTAVHPAAESGADNDERQSADTVPGVDGALVDEDGLADGHVVLAPLRLPRAPFLGKLAFLARLLAVPRVLATGKALHTRARGGGEGRGSTCEFNRLARASGRQPHSRSRAARAT